MRRSGQANQVRREEAQGRKFRWATLAAMLLVAVAEAAAQEQRNAGARVNDPSRPEPNRRIVISIPDRKLALIEDGRVVKLYPVAVGAKVSPSPTGEFKVANRIPDPTYYAPGKVVGPGPENPLGTRWIGLSLKGFGIHGTNEPRSIGRRASHGCIRMHREDVEELFELVRAGDVVELHGRRTGELAAIFAAPQAPTTGGTPAQPAALPVIAAVLAPR